MGVGDIVAMIIIGLSVFGPALSKWQQKIKAKGRSGGSAGAPSTSSSERATGLQMPRRASPKRASPSPSSQSQVALGSSSSEQTSVIRTIRRKQRVAASPSKPPRTAKPSPLASARTKHATEPQSPEAEIAAMHAKREAEHKLGQSSNWGAASTRRSWTRLQEAMVFRTILGGPRALQDEG